MQDGLGEARSLAQRQEQIERVMGATVGKFGDLQGIPGKSLQEIKVLEMGSLESDAKPRQLEF